MNLAQHISILLLRGYQRVISPVLASLAGPAGRCRFEPTCSQYAVEAIQIHGVLKGMGLAAWRICRCAPWGGCGHDPVPPKKTSKLHHEQARDIGHRKVCSTIHG